ncbi:MAG: hypothetical protein P0Y56_02450 [Candidatus Andeanibacterium colombiense]|uniref:Uncharacterized protein n=1 Tax=Candidatus Andeanibacterium colombiense TaxID=3121345 RepID=A0AAJ5XAI6_9SPHN|nr:MAG: hypothetical protein P0Y56_02450 [Sphingomonadaceae bacterium]
MTDTSMTSRRSFIKAGAIVAVPLAAAAIPAAAALADDGDKARLARIEDERAIGALNRAFLRRFNAGVRPEAFSLAGVTGLSLDTAADAGDLTIDQGRAQARLACTAEFEQPLDGEGTLFEMARLQGNSLGRLSEARSLVGSYVQTAQGWAIERIELA